MCILANLKGQQSPFLKMSYYIESPASCPPAYSFVQEPVIVMNPAVISHQLTSRPQLLPCHVCKMNVMSITTASSGSFSYLLGSVLCIFGCWLGCCLIPCCYEGCMDIEHHCARCRNCLGVYKRL